MIGCNIGSGQRRFKSPWFNFDLQVRKPDQVPDVQADMFRLPIRSGSLDYVCSHHIVEHMGCGEARGAMAEAYRTLRPGGSFVVCVPDLYELALGYVQKRINTYIFCVNLMGAYQGSEADRHRWHYTENSLAEELTAAAPWRQVKRFDARQLPGADIAIDWWILILEAVK